MSLSMLSRTKSSTVIFLIIIILLSIAGYRPVSGGEVCPRPPLIISVRSMYSVTTANRSDRPGRPTLERVRLHVRFFQGVRRVD